MFFDIRQIKHIQNFLDDTQLKKLCECSSTAPKQQATVGKIINGKYTTEYNDWCTADFIDYTSFIDSVHNITPRLTIEIENFYKVKVGNTPEIHYLSYKTGTYYKSHIDGQYIENGIAKRGIDRDITAVLYLNDDYSGGEVNFDFFNLKIKPKQNDLLIYPTTFQYKHSVSKVDGIRYAVVFWFTTDPWLNKDTILPEELLRNGAPTWT